MAQEKQIEDILAPYRAFITYVPLRTEIPFLDYVSLPSGIFYQIAPRASLDPEKEAERAMRAAGDNPTAILMPGRAFDMTGTRHGQGGGWYDRFLTFVPNSWLRIGFCYGKQLASIPLVRQPWDQAMDVLCVIEDGTLNVYETNARTI